MGPLWEEYFTYPSNMPEYGCDIQIPRICEIFFSHLIHSFFFLNSLFFRLSTLHSSSLVIITSLTYYLFIYSWHDYLIFLVVVVVVVVLLLLVVLLLRFIQRLSIHSPATAAGEQRFYSSCFDLDFFFLIVSYFYFVGIGESLVNSKNRLVAVQRNIINGLWLWSRRVIVVVWFSRMNCVQCTDMLCVM